MYSGFHKNQKKSELILLWDLDKSHMKIFVLSSSLVLQLLVEVSLTEVIDKIPLFYTICIVLFVHTAVFILR